MSTPSEPLGSGADTPASAGFARWVDQLATVDNNTDDAELINQISHLERLKSACAAAQAVLTVAFVGSQTDGLPAAKARDERVHRSIAAQVALARKDSPYRGGRHVGLAKVLTREMPNTFAALQTGEISEWRATLMVRETACLSVEHRQQVDAELAGKLGALGDKGTERAAAKIAQRLDAAASVKRHRKAVNERRVSIRPAPDTMTYVSALLPVAQGVAVYAALSKHADNARATGDPRSRGQVMADEVVTRITQPATAETDPAADTADTIDTADTVDTAGSADSQNPTPSAKGDCGEESPSGVTEQSCAENPADSAPDSGGDEPSIDMAGPDCAQNPDTSAPTGGGTQQPVRPAPTALSGNRSTTTTASTPSMPAGVNLDIQLVMTDRTLFDGDNEPAHLIGYGPIPAPLARHLIRDASPQVKAWIRRLYTDPDTGHLINGDARRRFFGHAERQFFTARDQACRTPYCDAPIRHSDHVAGHANNSPTNLTEGQGLCENCNYAKEAPGLVSRTEPDSRTITITTPTGHTYRSNPPPPPRSGPWAETEIPSAAVPITARPWLEALWAELHRTALRRPDTPRVDVTYPEIRCGERFEVA